MRTEKSAKGRASAAVMMLAIACAAGLPRTAGAETVLRIGMTAADIPRTLGQPIKVLRAIALPASPCMTR